jgi:N-acetylglucosaminyldiphosphoundecaprenol N-acetyl-beta-D-mannosaminyltransferase
MQEKIIILDIPFDNVSLQEALQKVEKMTENKGQFHIATPNPEILLEAEKNKEFKKLLQSTALNIPDGAGIILASRFLKWRGKEKNGLRQRVTGTDLMKKIIEHSENEHSPLFHKKIFLLGAKSGVAEKAAEKLKKQHPEAKIVGTYAGTPLPHDEEKITTLIKNSDAEILFVAYGAPAQEFWIARNLKKMPTVRVAMGVGGAFDFLAGVKKRAPQWMQKTATEWLFRLIQEPKRIKRIYNAVVKFPVLFLVKKERK